MSSAHEDVADAHAAQAEAAADFRPEAAAQQRQDQQPPRRQRDFPGREAASAQVRRLDEGRKRLGAAAAERLAPLRSSMQVRCGSKCLQSRSCWHVHSLLRAAQRGVHGCRVAAATCCLVGSFCLAFVAGTLPALGSFHA